MKPQRPYLFNAIYQWILDCGFTPHLLVDTAINSVEVPEHLIQDNKIVLNIDPNAIASFRAEDFGIMFSARFSGKSHQIVVPYAAMTALFSREQGQGMVFPEELFKEDFFDNHDMPESLKNDQKSELTKLKTIKSETAKSETTKSERSKKNTDSKEKNKKPNLTLIK
jgi:stringent starvation protein B